MTPDRAFFADVAWWDSNQISSAAASGRSRRRSAPGSTGDCVTHQHVAQVAGYSRAICTLVQEVTTLRTVIPTGVVIEAAVDPVLRGTCRGTARDPRTETTPALPVTSSRAA